MHMENFSEGYESDKEAFWTVALGFFVWHTQSFPVFSIWCQHFKIWKFYLKIWISLRISWQTDKYFYLSVGMNGAQ